MKRVVAVVTTPIVFCLAGYVFAQEFSQNKNFGQYKCANCSLENPAPGADEINFLIERVDSWNRTSAPGNQLKPSDVTPPPGGGGGEGGGGGGGSAGGRHGSPGSSGGGSTGTVAVRPPQRGE